MIDSDFENRVKDLYFFDAEFHARVHEAVIAAQRQSKHNLRGKALDTALVAAALALGNRWPARSGDD